VHPTGAAAPSDEHAKIEALFRGYGHEGGSAKWLVRTCLNAQPRHFPPLPGNARQHSANVRGIGYRLLAEEEAVRRSA
jgi:hypothetical protein